MTQTNIAIVDKQFDPEAMTYAWYNTIMEATGHTSPPSYLTRQSVCAFLIVESIYDTINTQVMSYLRGLPHIAGSLIGFKCNQTCTQLSVYVYGTAHRLPPYGTRQTTHNHGDN